MPGLPDVPEGLERQCNELLDDVLAALATIQPTYLEQHGRYWQGIRTHATLPADGNETAPDPTRRPTDQAHDWNDVGVPLPTKAPCAVQVDVYESPGGWGYVVSGWVVISGRTWVRHVNEGPEEWRGADWRDVTYEGFE